MEMKTENIEMLTYEEYCILLTALAREEKILQHIGDQKLIDISMEIRRKVKVLVWEELR